MRHLEIIAEGMVQGVGFRPFVYALARQHALSGFVLNEGRGVRIEVEGQHGRLLSFADALRAEAPPLSKIDRTRIRELPPVGFSDFTIRKSMTEGNKRMWISPDTTVCPACLRELFDPEDRRYLYPFINCTHCGPRFTIVEGIPYDRVQTTMRTFKMCPSCRREYEDPRDRRFHAQPNACSVCGPRVWLVDGDRAPLEEQVFVRAASLLRAGRILAIKGLGGFHLVCDARNEEAVKTLRGRKVREDKPFALMAANREMVADLCQADSEEMALLTDPRRPIVLLGRRVTSGIAEAVAPGSPMLGLMLPYTPLHHLLLREVNCPLVMTSGNRSDEPISYENEEALSSLSDIADVFLLHDRPIHVRCDDSVVRVFSGRRMMMRRARGYVPEPIALPFAAKRPVLACGAQLKNTFCLVRDQHAFVSHHIGDLENLETLRSFESGIAHYEGLFDIQPKVIACDLHPDYLSTRYAKERCELRIPEPLRRRRKENAIPSDFSEVPQSERTDPQGIGRGAITLVGVQHHHAHIASCLADNGLDRMVIGVALDGAGYGTDGTIWGGEFLTADCSSFERVAHLKRQGMPGGAMAIREPWRMAVSYLFSIFGESFSGIQVPFVRRLDQSRVDGLLIALQQGINCPQTSSAGRLFDAVAALIGVRDHVHYEGQAAVELEQLVSRACTDSYPFSIQEGTPLIIDTEVLFRGILEDLDNGASAGWIAAKFHNSLAEMIASVCVRIRANTGLDEVALSGGVFQNKLLLGLTAPLLEEHGFSVYTHHQVPSNDGGISLGQAAVAIRQTAQENTL
ncbi:MAG: carbamoyltransferase HypF [Candidatus Latescibacterota bacterium]